MSSQEQALWDLIERLRCAAAVSNGTGNSGRTSWVVGTHLFEEGLTTRFRLVLVCGKGHRMIYRRRPWLRLDQIQQLLSVWDVA